MPLSLICTAGRGTDKFVEEELRKKLKHLTLQVRRSDGKIFFEVHEKETKLEDLLSLKSIERILLEVNSFKTRRLPYGKGRGQFLNALKRRLIKTERLIESVESFLNLHQRTEETNLEPSSKKAKLINSETKTFRVSCKLSGRLSKLLTSQDVNLELGKQISKIAQWKVDLVSPLFEITVHINDDMVIAGIPITSYPVSKRSYILHHGLRSTIAWIMSSLAQIQQGDVVVDPMCGKSTILVEAVKSYPGGIYIGCDKDTEQLKFSRLNCQHARIDIHLIHANCLALPLMDGSVNRIICDAPFGYKYKTDEDITIFYTQMLQQFYRILKTGGRVVLLTSSSLRLHVIQSLNTSIKSDATPCTMEENVEGTQLQSKAEYKSDGQVDNIEAITSTISDKNGCLFKGQQSELSSCKTVDEGTHDESDSDGLHCDSVQYDKGCKKSETSCDKSESRTETPSLVYVEDHYVKLGESHAYIIVAVKL